MSNLIRKYLLDEAPVRKLEDVIIQCKPFLDELKATGWKAVLYKGSPTKNDISKGRITPHKCPPEANWGTWDAFYDVVNKKAGVDLRKSSVQCVALSDYTHSVPGGRKAHVILPIGNYKLFSSTQFDHFYTWEQLQTDSLYSKHEKDVRKDLERQFKYWNSKFEKEVYKILPAGMVDEVKKHSKESVGNIMYNCFDNIFAPKTMILGRCPYNGYDKASLIRDWGPNVWKWLQAASELFRKALADDYSYMSLKEAHSNKQTIYMICDGYYVLKSNAFKELKGKFK